jgi:response regulator RpfG family c-di-GMP phosphodiesterase
MNSWWLEAELYHEIIECLVTALEAKDTYTKGHSTRVADLAYQLGELAGLQGEALEDLHLAAHLHDIGKIRTPDDILNKKGPLTPDEILIIRQTIKKRTIISCCLVPTIGATGNGCGTGRKEWPEWEYVCWPMD